MNFSHLQNGSQSLLLPKAFVIESENECNWNLKKTIFEEWENCGQWLFERSKEVLQYAHICRDQVDAFVSSFEIV